MIIKKLQNFCTLLACSSQLKIGACGVKGKVVLSHMIIAYVNVIYVIVLNFSEVSTILAKALVLSENELRPHKVVPADTDPIVNHVGEYIMVPACAKGNKIIYPHQQQKLNSKTT